MAAFTVDIRGLDALLQRLQRAPKLLQDEVSAELQFGAENIAGLAKRNLAANKTTDEGRLGNAISVSKANPLEFNVVSPASYSPYIEWGTKRRVRVPSALSSYAAQFKGPGGGTAAQALKSIIGWVRRKGIRFDNANKFKSGKKRGQNRPLTLEQTAYIIFHYIMLNGIKPQPFFFKSLDAEGPKIVKNIENVLKDIL